MRVGPGVRRQLVSAGPERVVLLALGGAGEHLGRDGQAWSSWEDEGPGRPPQEVPMPADLPAPDHGAGASLEAEESARPRVHLAREGCLGAE